MPDPMPNPTGCCGGGPCCEGLIPKNRPLTVTISAPTSCCDGHTMTIQWNDHDGFWEGTGDIGGCVVQPFFSMQCFNDASGDHWTAGVTGGCPIPGVTSNDVHCDDSGGRIVFQYNLPPSPIVYTFTVTWQN